MLHRLLLVALWLSAFGGVSADESSGRNITAGHLSGRVLQQTQSAAIDPYNYTCTREERLSGRCRWCHRDYPSRQGTWTNTPPYWQLPGPCRNQAFDVEDTRKCLTGRTVYAVGNSIARQAPFNLVEMLGGNPVKREDQRDQCPKLQTAWGDSCHSEIAGVKLKYLFLQFPDGLHYADRGGFPFFRYKDPSGKGRWTTGRQVCKQTTDPKGVTSTEYCDSGHDLGADGAVNLSFGDNCVTQPTRVCLARFFEGSTERDILIVTLGMVFAMDNFDSEPSHSPGIDYKHWLRAQAAAFRGHLAATFKGQVFRVTHGEFHSQMQLAPKTANLLSINNLLWEEWQPDSSELPWYTIDQWPINQGRHALYTDAVHFNGPLTHAMLHQVLNELCPGGGKDVP